MSYTFRCEDAGANCPAVLEAPTEDALIAAIERHLTEVHAIREVTQTLRRYMWTLVS